jgi:hypothetical protein
MFEDTLKAWPAIIAAFASLVVACVSFLASRSNQRDLQRLQADLAEKQADRDAGRDYKYEALKRLYAEYEPVRFHLVEACEAARNFILELSTRSKATAAGADGSMPSGNYLRLASIYHLLLPAAYFKVMQRGLTLIDLEMSRASMLQYLITKEIFILFTQDSNIAKDADLIYTPYVSGWRQLRLQNPQRYRRQGFALGRLENALAALLRDVSNDSNGTPSTRMKVIDFGDFEAQMKDTTDIEYNSPLGAAADLFSEFDPKTRPILWLILITQFLLYELFLYSVRNGVTTLEALEKQLDTVVVLHARELEMNDGEVSVASRFLRKEVFGRLRTSFVIPKALERSAAPTRGVGAR